MDQTSITDVVETRKRFLASLRRRTCRDSSLKVAVETINFLRKVVIHEKYEDITELLSVLYQHGRLICASESTELVMRNAVLMVAKLAREENLTPGDDIVSPFDSLNKLWKKKEETETANNGKKLKKGLIQAVKEVVAEMESCRESIASQSSELLQPQDVIIVYSLNNSATLKEFLSNARKTVKHRVLSVVDSSEFDAVPEYSSPLALADVAGKMCEATRVVLPGAAVFPDGSCLVPAGALGICLSAQRHSVPVYVLAAFYKITPFFVPDGSDVNPPLGTALPFSLARQFSGKVEVLQHSFDIIPASIVTLYVSNSATILPSHVYRLISDYYHPEDVSQC